MRPGSRTHRFWLWWEYASWSIAGREIFLPTWPWLLFCAVKGHHVVDDHCGMPEHRFCTTCESPTPNKPIS